MRHFLRPAMLAGIFLGSALWGGIASSSVQAQTGKAAPTTKTAGKSKSGEKPKSGGSNSMMKRLLTQLGVTPDQMTKLKAVDDKNKKTVAGIKANKTLTEDQKKTLVKAEGKNMRKEAEVILTPAQREKLKTLMLQAAMERKNKMGGSGVAAKKP